MWLTRQSGGISEAHRPMMAESLQAGTFNAFWMSILKDIRLVHSSFLLNWLKAASLHLSAFFIPAGLKINFSFFLKLFKLQMGL